MPKERRWLTNVVKEAAKQKIDMPWARGPKRDAQVLQRKAEEAGRAARA